MSTSTQPTDSGSKSPAPKRTRRSKTKARRNQNTVTAKRFFDLVVLVLGEKSGFTANTPVPMREVEDEVLQRADLTDKERKQHDEKFLRRKIGFAFRNRRAEHVSKNVTALTIQTAPKQWALTEAGVEKAQELSGSVEELPPEPEPSEETHLDFANTPDESTGTVEAAPVDEVEDLLDRLTSDESETKAEKPKTTKQRKRGPRSISEATS